MEDFTGNLPQTQQEKEQEQARDAARDQAQKDYDKQSDSRSQEVDKLLKLTILFGRSAQEHSSKVLMGFDIVIINIYDMLFAPIGYA